MNYYPIVLFVYNRPDKAARILNNISDLRGADKTELFIFCDGPKADPTKVIKTREVVNNWKQEQTKIKKVHVIEREHNIGLAKSIITGVSAVMENNNAAIIVEDDLRLSRDFLIYMNKALDFYELNESIWSINGFSPISVSEGDDVGVFFAGRTLSWGWATWKDRWEQADWEVSTYKDIKFNILKRLKFAKWGNELPTMLDSQRYGLIDSWYIRWAYDGFRLNKMSVFPSRSIVINYGFDGSGTNCGFREDSPGEDVDIEADIEALFTANLMSKENIRHMYQKTTGFFWRREIKWFLIKIKLLPVETGEMDFTAMLHNMFKKKA